MTTAIVQRIVQQCDTLAACTEEPGRTTRTFLSPPMHTVHALLREWIIGAGAATVRVDEAGNVRGRWESTDSEAQTLVIGSHLDTVRDAGRYDGILGVLIGIAAMETLTRAGTVLPWAVEVIGFSEEEGVRFKTPYLGSRAVAGTFDLDLLSLRDDDGTTVAEAIAAFGLDPTQIANAAVAPESLAGYVEVHIEQGPVLEAATLPLGAVDAIVGQSRLGLRLTGQAGHAGTSPMPVRRDALAGAAEIVLAVEHGAAQDTTGLVATVGSLTVAPNVPNVVPGDVLFTLDVRHRDDARREAAVREIRAVAQAIADKRGLVLAVEREQHFDAVPMDAACTARLRDAVREATGTEPLTLPSGAGHDAAVFAPVTPSALLFIRSLKGGVSHHPDESVFPDDVRDALAALVRYIVGTAAAAALSAAR